MNPVSILGRYISKQIVLNFVGVLLMITGVIFLFEMIEVLRRTADRPEVDLAFMFDLTLSKLPQTFEMVLPFVMMIAAMMCFWKLSRSNEYVVVRSAGVSIWGFLTPVLVTAFLLGIINITVVNPLSSYLYERYETLNYRLTSRNEQAMLFSDKGLWIREAIDEERFLILSAKQVRQEDDTLVLRKASILEVDKDSQIIKRVEAYAAELKGGKFDLKDVKIYQAGHPVVSHSNSQYETSLTLERIKENFIEPEAISFWNLPSTIRFYEISGFSALRHNMRYMSLLASPLLLCGMVLIAAVFALRPNSRGGGVLYLIVGGIASGFVVYFLSQVIYAFGINSYIPAVLAVWAPSLIILMVSVSVLLQIEDD